MTIGKALRDLGGAVDELETGDAEVVTIGIADGPDDASDAVSATVDLAVRLYGNDPGEGIDIAAGDAWLDDEGRLRLDLVITAHGEEGNDSSAANADDNAAVAAPDPSGEGDPGVDETADRDDQAVADDTVPPHRDPERLREVYDEDRTFAEMTEALDTDVTAQTVRRNMIEHGIHEPSPATETDPSGSTPSEGDDADGGGSDTEAADGDDADGAEADDAESADADEEDVKTALADGIDLPVGTSLDDIKDAVRSGRTLYEVQTTLDVDRARARRLLRELDLIELVGGRLRSGERDVTESEIEERIQGAAPLRT